MFPVVGKSTSRYSPTKTPFTHHRTIPFATPRVPYSTCHSSWYLPAGVGHPPPARISAARTRGRPVDHVSVRCRASRVANRIRELEHVGWGERRRGSLRKSHQAPIGVIIVPTGRGQGVEWLVCENGIRRTRYIRPRCGQRCGAAHVNFVVPYLVPQRL